VVETNTPVTDAAKQSASQPTKAIRGCLAGGMGEFVTSIIICFLKPNQIAVMRNAGQK
jgi:hypothetical protein